MGIIVTLILLFFYSGMISRIGVEKASKYTLLFTIFTIPFPYLINFMQKDALTITTILIFFLLTFITIDSSVRKKIVHIPKFAFVLPILIFFSFTISLVSNPYFVGQSIRYYTESVSGILLYFVLLFLIKTRSDAILVVKILLLALILQSGIAFLQLAFPEADKYFISFGTRTLNPSAIVDVEGFTRATGTIWDYELLAQWFLIGSILSIALIYIEKTFKYSFQLFCCIVGILATKTRSDMVLLVIALMLIYALLIVFRKGYKSNLVKIALIISFIGMLIILIFPKQVNEIGKRLETYFNSESLISSKSINRKQVWEAARFAFIRKPTLFGRGFYRIISIGHSGIYSFHSLYLTLLYKIGVFGLLAYALFWLGMLRSSWDALVNKRKHDSWYLLFFLFICVILMLLDGIKIEYLRYGHTIQFAWVTYALLIIALRQIRQGDESAPNPKLQ